MANYTSGYSGSQLDAILSLFHNKGLGDVSGVVKRNSNGTFTYQPIDSTISNSSTNPIQNQAVHAAIADAVATITADIPSIYFDTKAHWDAQTTLVGEANAIYIYTDYKTIDNKNVHGIKIGDGNAYLIDNPFIDALMQNHINNTDIHITSAERDFWNNKVTCYPSLTDEETIIFTKN